MSIFAIDLIKLLNKYGVKNYLLIFREGNKLTRVTDRGDELISLIDFIAGEMAGGSIEASGSVKIPKNKL